MDEGWMDEGWRRVEEEEEEEADFRHNKKKKWTSLLNPPQSVPGQLLHSTTLHGNPCFLASPTHSVRAAINESHPSTGHPGSG